MGKEILFGIPIANVNSVEALEIIKKFLIEEKVHQIITVNSLMIFRSFFDKKFREILKKSELNIVDSVGVKFALLMKGIKLKERIAGIDFARKIMNYAEDNNKTIFLLGGTFNVITDTEKNIKATFKSLHIVGRYHGYFKVNENKKIITAINKVTPDFLFVAMGSPKQEKWIYLNKDNLKVKVAIGLGGSFDIYSGYKHRAPHFFRKTGTEWLYRIATDPIRIYQLIPLFLFFLLSVGLGFINLFKKSKKNEIEKKEKEEK